MNFSINNFWTSTPLSLKYILIFTIFISVFYFALQNRIYQSKIKQIEKIEIGIAITYELMDNIDQFRIIQFKYNEETLTYLKTLYSLIKELQSSSDKKLKIDSSNTELILRKIDQLNESLEKLKESYKDQVKNIEKASLELPIGIDISNTNEYLIRLQRDTANE